MAKTENYEGTKEPSPCSSIRRALLISAEVFVIEKSSTQKHEAMGETRDDYLFRRLRFGDFSRCFFVFSFFVLFCSAFRAHVKRRREVFIRTRIEMKNNRSSPVINEITLSEWSETATQTPREDVFLLFHQLFLRNQSFFLLSRLHDQVDSLGLGCLFILGLPYAPRSASDDEFSMSEDASGQRLV